MKISVPKVCVLAVVPLSLALCTSMLAGCGSDSAGTPPVIQTGNPGPPGNPGNPGTIGGITISQASAIVEVFQGATPPVGVATAPTVGIQPTSVARGSSATITVNSPSPVQRIYATVDQAPNNYLRISFVNPNLGNQLTTVSNPVLTAAVAAIVPAGSYTLRISTQDANGNISAPSPLAVTVT